MEKKKKKILICKKRQEGNVWGPDSDNYPQCQKHITELNKQELQQLEAQQLEQLVTVLPSDGVFMDPTPTSPGLVPRPSSAFKHTHPLRRSPLLQTHLLFLEMQKVDPLKLLLPSSRCLSSRRSWRRRAGGHTAAGGSSSSSSGRCAASGGSRLDDTRSDLQLRPSDHTC